MRNGRMGSFGAGRGLLSLLSVVALFGIGLLASMPASAQFTITNPTPAPTVSFTVPNAYESVSAHCDLNVDAVSGGSCTGGWTFSLIQKFRFYDSGGSLTHTESVTATNNGQITWQSYSYVFSPSNFRYSYISAEKATANTLAHTGDVTFTLAYYTVASGTYDLVHYSPFSDTGLVNVGPYTSPETASVCCGGPL